MSATLFLVAGCATVSPGVYYWGDYDYTSLNVIKDPTEKTRNAHQAELQEIIGKSAELGLRTPPGIHAELGQLYVKKRSNDGGFGAIPTGDKTLSGVKNLSR